ncbi:putative zinc finger motif, C2HC5-type-domain-containing protein [Phycomyces nitens]|nr:putative zinc finger motif, C2HC5-type-domain-containing protein [Phycomyces nitens]
MEYWATEKLSIFLGLDTHTLETQVLPYLITLETADELTEHLTNMLGTSPDCLDFIYEFASRRFAQEKPKQQTSLPSKEMPFPSLPAGESNSQWPANINIQVKNGESMTEGLYKTKKQTKPKASSSSSDKQQKKKKEITLETAFKELQIKANDNKRKPCQCQATKHPLLDIAPNCLNCGKIICTLEGPGPCTFCGTEILSDEQKINLISEAKKKRAEIKNEQHQQHQQQQQVRRVKNPVRKHGYANVLSGDFISGQSIQEEEEEARRKAEEQKQQKPPINGKDSPRRRVLTLDMKTKKVRVEYESDTEEESAEEYSVVIRRRKKGSKEDGFFANNPLLQDLIPPKFVKKTKGPLNRRMLKKMDD